MQLWRRDHSLKMYSVTFIHHCEGTARHRVTGQPRRAHWDEHCLEMVEAENAARAVVIQAQLNDARGWKCTMQGVVPCTR